MKENTAKLGLRNGSGQPVSDRLPVSDSLPVSDNLPVSDRDSQFTRQSSDTHCSRNSLETVRERSECPYQTMCMTTNSQTVSV